MTRSKIKTEIPPKKKRFKVIVVKTVLFALKRAICFASRFDGNIKTELESWPDNYTVVFKVYPNGPMMGLRVVDKGKKKIFRGWKPDEEKGDLVIYFKNIDAAYLALTARIGTIQAFIEKRNMMRGDVPKAMSFIRCLNIVQVYLFPRFIAKRVMKEPPKIKWYKRYLGRTAIMTIGIPSGL